MFFSTPFCTTMNQKINMWMQSKGIARSLNFGKKNLPKCGDLGHKEREISHRNKSELVEDAICDRKNHRNRRSDQNSALDSAGSPDFAF